MIFPIFTSRHDADTIAYDIQKILEKQYTPGLDKVKSYGLLDSGRIAGEFVAGRQTFFYSIDPRDGSFTYRPAGTSKQDSWSRFDAPRVKAGAKTAANKAGKTLTCTEGKTYPCGAVCRAFGKNCKADPDAESRALAQKAAAKIEVAAGTAKAKGKVATKRKTESTEMTSNAKRAFQELFNIASKYATLAKKNRLEVLEVEGVEILEDQRNTPEAEEVVGAMKELMKMGFVKERKIRSKRYKDRVVSRTYILTPKAVEYGESMLKTQGTNKKSPSEQAAFEAGLKGDPPPSVNPEPQPQTEVPGQLGLFDPTPPPAPVRSTYQPQAKSPEFLAAEAKVKKERPNGTGYTKTQREWVAKTVAENLDRILDIGGDIPAESLQTLMQVSEIYKEKLEEIQQNIKNFEGKTDPYSMGQKDYWQVEASPGHDTRLKVNGISTNPVHKKNASALKKAGFLLPGRYYNDFYLTPKGKKAIEKIEQAREQPPIEINIPGGGKYTLPVTSVAVDYFIKSVGLKKEDIQKYSKSRSDSLLTLQIIFDSLTRPLTA